MMGKAATKGLAMRLFHSGLASSFLILPASALHAQTVEIQRQIETKLWFNRLLNRLDEMGVPPTAFYIGVIVVVLLLVAAVWRWKSRKRKQE